METGSVNPYALWLTSIEGVGDKTIRALMSRVSGAEEVYHMTEEEIRLCLGETMRKQTDIVKKAAQVGRGDPRLPVRDLLYRKSPARRPAVRRGHRSEELLRIRQGAGQDICGEAGLQGDQHRQRHGQGRRRDRRKSGGHGRREFLRRAGLRRGCDLSP